MQVFGEMGMAWRGLDAGGARASGGHGPLYLLKNRRQREILEKRSAGERREMEEGEGSPTAQRRTPE